MSAVNLSPEQVKKLAEIGAHLRSVRTEKGISKEDVAAKTLIQPRFIDAIEEGNATGLPEPLYVRGFIRRMADAVGVDGVQLSESFPLPQQSQPLSSVDKLSGSASPSLRPWHLYIIYAVAFAAAAIGLAYIVNSQVNKTPAPASSPAPSPVASPSPSPQPSPKPSPKPKQSTPVQAKLVLKGDSYMEITADGQSNFVGTLKAGETKTINAQQTIEIFAGNAGGVDLSVNSNPSRILGQPGEVKTVTLTPGSK